MKHASYLAQKPLPGITPHAEECMAKIRAMLTPKIKEYATEPAEDREPGQDDEEPAW